MRISAQKLMESQCLPHFLIPPTRIREFRKIVRGFSDPEFEWLQGLRSLGYGYDDIAELLPDE